MPLNQEKQETAKKVARQAKSFCWQFTEGCISLSEFLFAAIALEAANRDLIAELYATSGSEQDLL